MSNDTDFSREVRRKHHAAIDKIRQSKSENTADDTVTGTSPYFSCEGENRLPSNPAICYDHSIGAESNLRYRAGLTTTRASAATWLKYDQDSGSRYDQIEAELAGSNGSLFSPCAREVGEVP